jgi:hypothetical protein
MAATKIPAIAAPFSSSTITVVASLVSQSSRHHDLPLRAESNARKAACRRTALQGEG